MAAHRIHAHGPWARARAHAGHVLGGAPRAAEGTWGRLPQLIVAMRKAALVAAVALPRLHELLAQLGLVHGHVRRLQQQPRHPSCFPEVSKTKLQCRRTRMSTVLSTLPLQVSGLIKHHVIRCDA